MIEARAIIAKIRTTIGLKLINADACALVEDKDKVFDFIKITKIKLTIDKTAETIKEIKVNLNLLFLSYKLSISSFIETDRATSSKKLNIKLNKHISANEL